MDSHNTNPLFELLNLVFGLEAKLQSSPIFEEDLKGLYSKYEYEINKIESKTLSILTSAWLDADGAFFQTRDQAILALVILKIEFDMNRICYLCPIDYDVIQADLTQFCQVQNDLKHLDFKPEIYLMNSGFNVHPKVQYYSDLISSTEAIQIMQEMEIARNSDGQFSAVHLKKIIYNEDGNVSLEMRAAAFRLLNSGCNAF